MRPTAAETSLLKAWVFPLFFLLASAAGIASLAIWDPSAGISASRPRPDRKIPQENALVLEGRAAKIKALQNEIESLQTLLLADAKRTAGGNGAQRGKTFEHQLARLSVAAGELDGIRHDLERHALEVTAQNTESRSAAESTWVRPLTQSGLVVLALCCCLAAFVIVRRIAGTIAKPVDHFVEIALAITHGRPNERASLKSAGHLGPLVAAFNQMIDARQQAEVRLKQAHDSLEFKIRARTVELFRSNKALVEETQQRAQAERDFQQAQKMDALGKLAGSIAHDFNNLLGVIIGGAECAQERLEPHHPSFRLIQTIQQAAERAAGLTRPLLTFSRSQSLTLETIDLNAAAEEANGLLQRLVGINIQLKLELAPELHAVQANSNQIQQVIMNLAVNARDAMDGAGELRIITRSATIDEGARERAGAPPAESWVELAVTDTGSGMDEATKARIFEPFFTTKPAGRGTGLGLATVFGIVKQSSGFLAVESVQGQGSTFRVFLPAAASAAPCTVAVASIAPDPAPRCSNHETILLVDDEEDLRELAQMTLEAEGYRVLTAANAEEAIMIAKQQRGIQALVTDVLMPGMTGVDLAGLLIRVLPNLRVLFVSGYNNESISADNPLISHADYLQKPYRGHVLAAKVREVLTAPKLLAASSWSAEDLAQAV